MKQEHVIDSVHGKESECYVIRKVVGEQSSQKPHGAGGQSP